MGAMKALYTEAQEDLIREIKQSWPGVARLVEALIYEEAEEVDYRAALMVEQWYEQHPREVLVTPVK